MFKERLRKDNRGMTLIELICAVAILSVITATVGGAMVVATNTYRSGTVETSIQQEAQFTANAIESLIIDATNQVEYSGNVLTINNTDYTYTITYDSAAQTLHYSQYDVVNGTYLATNQLLAENISEFNMDTSDFATTRNARLTLGMTRDGKTFKTNYNVTSRNDVNAGTPLPASAVINVLDEITLEPRQVYDLAVSVVSTTGNTNYNIAFEPEEDGTIDASFTRTATGVQISIGATENGGTDGMIRLLLTTAATDAGGNALQSKIVKIHIRRINQVALSTVTLESGDDLEAGAVYSLVATPNGTNLSRVPLAEYDNDYVDPNTLQWSFDVPSGFVWTDFVTLLSGTQDNAVRFRLNRAIGAGQYVKIIAKALHPEGTYVSEATHALTNSNKTGLDYGDVENSVTLSPRNPFGDAILRRSIDIEVSANFDYYELVRQDWERNNPGGTFDPNRDGWNGNYTGNVYYRYYSLDSDHKSPDYPKWHTFPNQGNNPTYLKFDSAVFSGMRIMEDYRLEVLFSFKYGGKTYPIGADTEEGRQNIASDYIYPFDMKAMGVGFDWMKDSAGTINLSSYLTANGKGVGKRNNYVPVQQGSWLEIHHHILGGVANVRDEIVDFARNAKMYVSDDGVTWTEKNGQLNYQFDESGGSKDMGKFTLDQNFYNNSGRHRYLKIVFETVKGEQYAGSYNDNTGGMGVIYLEFVNKY
ncbi:MAG: type II secretion system GspH family protein [Butyrivibrio sp.]|nr:type II secretion system GspH family protein [Muribaculum sp.]MCM1552433.1 type II secretion system GspH family protein [Butyrivibrio sp.]